MRIVVIGGTGLIGSKVVTHLTEQGHEAVAASLNTGVNIITGEGLADVMTGASVVVDLSNSPSFEDAAVLEFFETSTRNLLAAEAAANVTHHVALSVVGCDRLPDSGYLRAKVAQEQLIEKSGIPYSIVRATQFFEFVSRIADEATVDGVVRLPSGSVQPIASDEVALAGHPRGGECAVERAGRDRGPGPGGHGRLPSDRPGRAQRSARGGDRRARPVLRHRAGRRLPRPHRAGHVGRDPLRRLGDGLSQPRQVGVA